MLIQLQVYRCVDMDLRLDCVRKKLNEHNLTFFSFYHTFFLNSQIKEFRPEKEWPAHRHRRILD